MYVPKRNQKKIDNVDSSSILSLKDLIERRKEKKKNPTSSDSRKQKKRKNRGVDKRNARDKTEREQARKRAKNALKKKAELYERIISGKEKSKKSDLCSVDFEQKKIEKVWIKDEFNRDRQVFLGSEEHRNILKGIREAEEHTLRHNEEAELFIRGTSRIDPLDGGVKTHPNVLSDQAKMHLDKIRQETRKGREEAQNRKRRRESIMSRIRSNGEDEKKKMRDKNKALNLVQLLLNKRGGHHVPPTTTDESRSEQLLSDLFH